MRGRTPELSPDCDALTATTKPLVWLGHHRYTAEVTPANLIIFSQRSNRVKEIKNGRCR